MYNSTFIFMHLYSITVDAMNERNEDISNNIVVFRAVQEATLQFDPVISVRNPVLHTMSKAKRREYVELSQQNITIAIGTGQNVQEIVSIWIWKSSLLATPMCCALTLMLTYHWEQTQPVTSQHGWFSICNWTSFLWISTGIQWSRGNHVALWMQAWFR